MAEYGSIVFAVLFVGLLAAMNFMVFSALNSWRVDLNRRQSEFEERRAAYEKRKADRVARESAA